MKQLSISYEQTQATDKKLQPLIDSLSSYISSLASQNHNYESPAHFIQLPFETALRTQIYTLVARMQELNPKALVLIGIGGSNLGTVAVYEALLGKLYNLHAPEISVYCADTVDTDALWDIVLCIEEHFERGQEVIINIISKSGTTLETIANMQLFFALLQKYKGTDY